MSSLTKTFRWTHLFGGAEGTEIATVTTLSGCIVAEGEIIKAGEVENAAPCTIRYRILLSDEWHTRKAKINNITAEQTLVLHASGSGQWFDDDGADLPSLDKCMDIDIPESILMKTFPLRRRNLEAWEQARTRSASVHATALALHVDLERHIYSCYDDEWMLYRYDGRTSGATAEFFTDKECFVTKSIEGWSFTACYHAFSRDWEAPSEHHPTIPPRTRKVSVMDIDETEMEFSDSRSGSDRDDYSENHVLLNDYTEYEPLDGD
ncbi:putative glycolipid-binding-domain-containing protein [Aspergillus heterothallicus]